MEQKQLTNLEIALHWIVGLGMIGLIGLGLYMTRAENFALYGLHKSAGMILFIFILWRAINRLRLGWPEEATTGARWQHGVARAAHWVLILGTILMPLSGMLDAYMGGRGLSVFGLDLIAANIGDSGRPEAINATLAGMGETVHGVVGNILIATIVLHILGALKHHVVDHDATLRRMVGQH